MKIKLLIIQIFLTINIYSQIILKEPSIDKRIELISIAYDLAGSRRFTANSFPI